MPWRSAWLDGVGRPSVRDAALAADLHLPHRGRDLLVEHPGRLRRRLRREVVARQVELDRVDAVLEEHPYRLAHLVRARDVDPEAEFGERQVRQRLVAERAQDGDLLAGGEVARSGDLAAVDRVADHDVQARLGTGRADAGGPAGFQVTPGDLGAPQHVLLQRHGLDARERGRVVPREVRVGLAHAGHQGRAGTVDDARVAGRDRRGAAADLADAVALHQDAAGVRVLAGAVEDADVGEEGVGHGVLLQAAQRVVREARTAGAR